MLSKRMNTIKRIVSILPFTALLIGNVAFAHDEFKSKALEGTTEDNAVTIAHACEASEKPIIAQSVVFPGADAVLSDSEGNPIGGISSLADVIDQGSLAGLVDLIQSRDIFHKQTEKHDALGNVIGFEGTKGLLATDLQGRVPFAFTAPNFKSDSCVKQLNIQVAIADICDRTAPIDANKVNLWIPNNGSIYAIEGVDGVGEPAVLQVYRDLTANNFTNPSCGEGIVATVTATAGDIDANLGIPGYWPHGGGHGDHHKAGSAKR